jgi:orotate phosphoribosyltransferase
MSNQTEILDIFEKTGALFKGHFLLSSGLHSDLYFEKFQVLQYPEYVEILCRKLAAFFKDDQIEVVVGPTTGGVIIAYEVAKNLSTIGRSTSGGKVRSIFAEPGEDGRIFKRGFGLKKGERVLIVDDILTTGGSVNEVIQLVKKHEANILGIGVLLDRSGGQVKFDYPLKALAVTEVTNYRPEECPLCKKGEPLIKPGSRKIQ